MALPTHVLMMYGYLLLFAWVFVEQIGVPLPATPVLLAAGALSVDGPIRFPLALLAAVVAALSADCTWFLIGRKHGHHVLRILCKLSIEPTTCVRRTQDSFGRRRGVMLMFAKFVPGLGMLAPPVAGQNGMEFGPFLFFDAIGVTLWVSVLLTAGRLFGDLLNRNPSVLNWAGRFSGALLLLGIAGFFVARVLLRRVILKALAASRLEPEELMRQLEAGEEVYIVDLRHPLELLPDPYTLPGAVHISPEALTARQHEIPRDRDVVLYCTCPSEATSAKTALALHKLGIERVRPLRGGFDEWKRLGYPMDAIPPVMPMIQAVAPAK
ncbi:DedA family protein [Candidatus Sulfotelmatomonas gaucii]|uniref:DedA family protein n=1 Tax=Candidatus Sulfuritelmatomonas gaucii TaxID=2043161 RepID=A0A2N9LQE9_9BACT|nr:DedA family protein [Candidatus Sulfotelmatomonas gaucii]